MRAAQGFPAPEGDGKTGAWLAFARDGQTVPNLLPTLKLKKRSEKRAIGKERASAGWQAAECCEATYKCALRDFWVSSKTGDHESKST